ncbi:hypothetical protein Q8F55_003400 [Vanrija albida]|uniref:Uncharacterized protein n=1 Tax=Vanrija albida TaxID=181172 RepID=A0ABR3Q4P0_9TREE
MTNPTTSHPTPSTFLLVDIAAIAHGFNITAARLKTLPPHVVAELVEHPNDFGDLDTEDHCLLMPAIVAGHKAYLNHMEYKSDYSWADRIDAQHFIALLVATVNRRAEFMGPTKHGHHRPTMRQTGPLPPLVVFGYHKGLLPYILDPALHIGLKATFDRFRTTERFMATEIRRVGMPDTARAATRDRYHQIHMATFLSEDIQAIPDAIHHGHGVTVKLQSSPIGYEEFRNLYAAAAAALVWSYIDHYFVD